MCQLPPEWRLGFCGLPLKGGRGREQNGGGAAVGSRNIQAYVGGLCTAKQQPRAAALAGSITNTCM